VDNLARAIRYTTRQIVDLIPKIYDTQRIARIINLDGETSMAKIDPMQAEAVKVIRDENNIEIDKIYNPSVGRYDVVVTSGPSYMTKRQEALDGMAQLLQGNPQLWGVAGDLFVKHMDWPGAAELSNRIAKSMDPKLFENSDKSPALQAAEQKIQALSQELDQMHGMFQNVTKSVEVQTLAVKEFEATIKAYDAETKRISAVQASMSPEQIQDIVLGTVHGMITSGDLIAEMPGQELPGELPNEPMQAMMPPSQGIPQ
jgi:hypothetical protein